MSRTSNRTTTVVALLVAPALLLAACGGGDDSEPAPTTTERPPDDSPDTTAGSTTTTEGRRPTTTARAPEPMDGGTIAFAVEADSDGYHPIFNRWSISGNYVASAVYEPLVVEVGDGTLEPWLAESVSPNDDGTEWTIVTKEGISFHDGTPFDAEAVAANIEARMANPLTALTHEPIESVTVEDATTLTVTMKDPWASFDHVLATQSGYMAGPASLGDDGDPAAVIGTGPFRYVDWVPDSHFQVERNDEYWRDPAHLDEIRFVFLPDVTTRRAALEAGDVDAIISPDADAILDWRDSTDVTMFEHSSEPMHVLLNRAVPPMDNPVAREALALATDPETIISVLGGEGVLEPATSPFVASNPWHLADNGYPEPDLDGARELVDQYEAETGSPLEVTIIGSSAQEELLGGALVEQWGAAGITATFEPVEQAAFLGQIVVGDYQAALWRSHNWIDPDFNYIFWHSSTSEPVGDVSVNFTHTESPELDAALDAGRATLDPDERRAAYDDVQRILNEELSHLWLFGQVWALVSRPEIHGWDDLVARGLSRLEPKVFWADVWIDA